MAPPTKRARLLEDSSGNDSSSGEEDGLSLTNGNSESAKFRINTDFAKKFEHNKKREELHRLEEKLGKSSGSSKPRKSLKSNGQVKSETDASEDTSSDSEDEDDEGELATEALDAEISATLTAIRSRDPRVFDQNVTFYTQIEEDEQGEDNRPKTIKPMYLRDYHRETLLSGTTEQDDSGSRRTFAEEQEHLKRNIVEEINAATKAGKRSIVDSDDSETSEDEGFLVAKKTTRRRKMDGPSQAVDVEIADKDPETFLSNFLAARAWVPTTASRFQPFESDDEEEDRRADEFEDAYNFRFEDPSKANEKLLSHARGPISQYSARREEPNRRKKQRDLEQEKKETAKLERHEERARLRKLKIEELESKVKRIKEAAGRKHSDIRDEDWETFLEDAWDNEKWEEEMAKRFNEGYYAETDNDESEEGEEEATSRKTKKLKKPKWDEDIDINDIVPDFRKEQEPEFSLTEDSEDEHLMNVVEGHEGPAEKPRDAKKHARAQEQKERRKEARKERKRIEQIVDQKINIENAITSKSSKLRTPFRYRDTSPTSYGLNATDILMANDSQLNQYAGLKKLAAFRDAEKKRKDQKNLGKKARLRKWRKETFGNEDGPSQSLADFWKAQALGKAEAQEEDATAVDIREGKKKRKRSRKMKHEAL